MALDRRRFLGSAALGMGYALAPALAYRAHPNRPSFPAFHRDKFGLIVQSDGDGGDTAQREGFVWLALFIRQKKLNLGDPSYVNGRLTFKDTMTLLEVHQTGIFRRHPDPAHWWSDPSKFSRDQQIPIVAALGAWALTEPLERLWRATVGRGRICQNGDAVGPDHYNLFQRSRGATLEIDPAGELQLLAMNASIIARSPDDVSDDLNHIVSLAVSALVNPTRTSRRAIASYVNDRPHTCGSYLERYYQSFGRTVSDLGLQKARIEGWIDQGIDAIPPDPGCSPVYGALRWYFRPETGGNPGIADLYRPIVDGYFSREGRV